MQKAEATVTTRCDSAASCASSETWAMSQGMKPHVRPFKRGFDRLGSVTSPCKKLKTGQPMTGQQVLSNASAERVILKPPARSAIPGKAGPRAKPPLCNSTYARMTERQALDDLFRQPCDFQSASLHSSCDAAAMAEMLSEGFEQASARHANDKHSFWARAGSSCGPGRNGAFTPLPKRIEAQKARRREQPQPATQQASELGSLNREQRNQGIVTVHCHRSAAEGTQAMTAPEKEREKEVEGALIEPSSKKPLAGARLLQLNALREELRAAEGTVAELKHLIAELEMG